jgi:hypothetical protein
MYIDQDMDVDLAVALKMLHELQLKDGDLGAQYWLKIAMLLKAGSAYRKRALEAENKLQKIVEICG